MPQFFIDRPIFAWVVALFILLAGFLAIPQLPVAQYPNVAPPKVEIYDINIFTKSNKQLPILLITNITRIKYFNFLRA